MTTIGSAFPSVLRRSGPLAVLLVLCTVALALSFTNFNAPGAGTAAGEGTEAIGINGAEIIGTYIDSKTALHGFLLSTSGSFTAINPPGAGTAAGLGTVAEGINNAGTIAGYYTDKSMVFHGFVLSTNGVYTILNASGAGTKAGDGTLAANINTSGEVAGFYAESTGASKGFVWTSKSGFTTFEALGSGTGSGQGTFTAGFDGLNDSGEVAGDYIDSKGVAHGYLRSSGGVFTDINASGAGTSSGQGTFASGVNDDGTFVGLYIDSNNANHGLVRSSSGTITEFNVLGAGTSDTGCPKNSSGALTACQGTFPQNINSWGMIVGYYVDSKIVAHGFARSVSGGIRIFNDPDAGTAAGQGTFGISNSTLAHPLFEEITGYYVDSKNVLHGFEYYQ